MTRPAGSGLHRATSARTTDARRSARLTSASRHDEAELSITTTRPVVGRQAENSPTPPYASTTTGASTAPSAAAPSTVDQGLGTIGPGLEEGSGRDLQPATRNHLVEHRFWPQLHVGRDLGRGGSLVGHHSGQSRAGSSGAAQRHLVGAREAAIADHLLEGRVGDQAVRHRDDVVRAGLPVAEALVDHGQADRGAEALAGQLRPHRHDGVTHPADPFEWRRS